MGKKNRRKQKSNNTAQTPMAASFRNMAQRNREESMAESFAAMDKLDRYTLEGQKRIIRGILKILGTDMVKNDADLMGNGDQSAISSSEGREAARTLYSIGGDIHKHAEENAFSQLAMMCLLGSVGAVRTMIDNVSDKIPQPHSRQRDMIALLETRETSLRLSPLLLIVSAGKNAAGQPDMDHSGVAKLLLKSGASPDAKDVLGKTVCHYGAGAMATSMTMEVVEMCIQASKSSYLYGKDVELYGLKKEDMNGCKAVAGGYDPDSKRRVVYIPEMQKEVWVKPVNIRLADGCDTTDKEKPMLADVQDRMGSVSLHEVIMQDREDVARFLLSHDTSVHTKDMDGLSPVKMSSGGGMMASNVCQLVMDATREDANKLRKEQKHDAKGACWNCKKNLDEKNRKRCSACSVAVYCGYDCQKAHWKNGHKAQCNELKNQSRTKSAGVKLKPPSGKFTHTSTISLMSGAANSRGSYRIPDGVSPGDKFTIKVQGGTEVTPIMVYDESRTCSFTIAPGQPGFQEILTEMKKEMAWGGRKTFMKASFDDAGDCTVYPATAGVKSGYSW